MRNVSRGFGRFATQTQMIRHLRETQIHATIADQLTESNRSGSGHLVIERELERSLQLGPDQTW
jgi:hypothetical protein